ncbi:MAG TPA: AMP-binding protein [Rhodocyclaceae bacterium]
MAATRLIAHDHPDAIVARRGSEAITAAQFLADVRRLAGYLPESGHVLNVCTDRYRFAVGIYAALLRKTVSLLPPAHTPEMVERLREFAPDVVCLADGQVDIALPRIDCPADAAPVAGPFAVPEIDDEQVVAHVFTSGSTGLPQRHTKTWERLVRNVRGEARRLGLVDADRRASILGTVPPQHMYGFETTVMMPLQSSSAFDAGRPFYPADITAALAALPRPRLLVSTPFHLRTLLDAGLACPPADLVVSATAPLSAGLAAQAEAAFGCALLEIYGMTETGQLATRRTTAGDTWQAFDGIELSTDSGPVIAAGGHIETPVALGDLVELVDATHFRLLGRGADMVNIAGKRTSLGYLNHQLLAIDGVADGVFVLPDHEAADGVTRLAAIVVAPGRTRQQILGALRTRIDPVFLPRPLVLVDALPRNATGKLPRETLLAMLPGHAEAG